MPNLIDSAAAILVASEKRAQSSAQDISNASTNGYKQQVDFARLLELTGVDRAQLPETRFTRDFSQGQMIETGRSLDLAISGTAVLALRIGEGVVFGRGGSFAIAENGRLETAAGHVLQDAAGGDLTVSGGALEFLADGTVLEDGLPVGTAALLDMPQDAVLDALGGSVFAIGAGAIPEPASGSTLRQGFLEKSNVVLSDEMVSMMTAVRQAETGARVTQFYDQLMGQAITTFSRGSR